MEFNIARIARDVHNKTYKNKLELDHFIKLDEGVKKEQTQEEFDKNVEIIRNIYKRAGIYK